MAALLSILSLSLLVLFICLCDMFHKFNHIDKKSDLHCYHNYYTYRDCLDDWLHMESLIVSHDVWLIIRVFSGHCKLFIATHSSNTNDFTLQKTCYKGDTLLSITPLCKPLVHLPTVLFLYSTILVILNSMPKDDRILCFFLVVTSQDYVCG